MRPTTTNRRPASAGRQGASRDDAPDPRDARLQSGASNDPDGPGGVSDAPPDIAPSDNDETGDPTQVGPPPGVSKMTVVWYGHVQKVGRQLQAHERVVFVTDACVYVCLPTGGVTRSIQLNVIRACVRVPPAVTQIVMHGTAPDLVVAHASEEERDNFIAALGSARLSAVAASRGRRGRGADDDEEAGEDDDRDGADVQPLVLMDRKTHLWKDDNENDASAAQTGGRSGAEATLGVRNADAALMSQRRRKVVESAVGPAPPRSGGAADVSRGSSRAETPPRSRKGSSVGRNDPLHPSEFVAGGGAPSPAFEHTPDTAAAPSATRFREVEIPPAPYRAQQQTQNAPLDAAGSQSARPTARAGPQLVPPGIPPAPVGTGRSFRDAAGLEDTASLLVPLDTSGRMASGYTQPSEVDREHGSVGRRPPRAGPSSTLASLQPDVVASPSNRAAVGAPSVAAGTAPRSGSSMPSHPYGGGSVDHHSAAAGGGSPSSHDRAGSQPATGGSDGVPASFAGDEAMGRRFAERERQIADLRHAIDSGVTVVDTPSIQALHDRIDRQSRIIEELKQTSSDSQVMQLQRDLEHARSVIADMKTALRTQEGIFHEMVRAQEAQRVAEDLRSVSERQVSALTAENDALKRQLTERDRDLLRVQDDLKASNDRHKLEMDTVRKAFVEYDENVAAYLESLRAQREQAAAGGPSMHHDGGSFFGGSATPPPTGVASTPGFPGRPLAFQFPRGGGVGEVSSARGGGAAANAAASGLHPALAATFSSPSANLGGSPAGVRGVPAGGIAPDELSAALIQHLNAYANRRFHLPPNHPAPQDVLASRSPRHAGINESSSAGISATLVNRQRDRSVL